MPDNRLQGPQIDIVDSTWIDAPPPVLAGLVADPANWRRWWPRLRLVVAQLRGPKGVRWAVPSGEGGTVSGSMEVWLEGIGEAPHQSVVAHYFLRLDGTAGPLPPRRARALTHRYRVDAKALFWGLSDALDPGRLGRVRAPSPSRAAGEPATPEPVASLE